MAIFGNNALNPEAPEFGKAWKAEFNKGCCTSCGGEITPPVCTTITSYFTRDDRSESLVIRTENDYSCPCQNPKPTATDCSDCE
jgi:hypothetical protein